MKYKIGLLSPSDDGKPRVIFPFETNDLPEIKKYIIQHIQQGATVEDFELPDFDEVKSMLEMPEARQKCLIYEPYGWNILADFVFGLKEAFDKEYGKIIDV